MRAALFLRERGHDVTIYEASDKLGGAICHADSVPFKWTLKQYKDWLIYQVHKQGVQVELGRAVTPAEIEAEGYDAVIAALGTEPVTPNIPGAD